MLITEAILRAGWYDRWLRPQSYMGNAIYRLTEIELLGKSNIDWITVGDSRIDWGLDHGKIAEAQRSKGIQHVRMSFESSYFPALQATVDWSAEHMSNLKGVLLGTTESNLAQYVNMEKQFKVAWPFKSHFDFDQYKLNKTNQASQKFWSQMAWFNYFADIQEFIKNPVRRLKQISLYKNGVRGALQFKKTTSGNLCAHPLETLQQCITSTTKVDHTINGNRGFRLLNELCSTNQSKARAESNSPVPDQANALNLIDNWTKLIKNILAQRKQFILVLLPEHESHNYVIKPANASLITQRILAQLKQNRNFKLIDLRGILVDERNCEMFVDPTHYSEAGINKITNALLKQL